MLLYWLYKSGLNEEDLESSREEVIRFVMFWGLCVKDAPKVSLLAFRKIREQKIPSDESLFQSIYLEAVEKGHALKLFSPASLERVIGSVVRSSFDADDTRPLRGWSRFAQETNELDERTAAKSLYRKWWSSGNSHKYNHLLLLWSQRGYVAELPGSPVAGRDEDTPYDFDHILPSAHWSHWTGAKEGKRIRDFMPEKDLQYWLVGNSIGNVRVWSSSDNRSDGADSPKVKLNRDNPDKTYTNSTISIEHKQHWDDCSADKADMRIWSSERSVAFQTAVEERAFYLFSHFFNDLKFGLWIGSSGESGK